MTNESSSATGAEHSVHRYDSNTGRCLVCGGHFGAELAALRQQLEACRATGQDLIRAAQPMRDALAEAQGKAALADRYRDVMNGEYQPVDDAYDALPPRDTGK